MIGPAGTGKSHILIALGIAAVEHGHRVRYFTAADLVDTLYRGLADNSVGKVIDTLLRDDLIIVDELGFAPLDDTGAQLLFRFVAAAYERRSLAIGSHWPFEAWGRFLPEHTTAVSMLDRLLHHATRRRHRRRVLPHETSQSERRNPTQDQLNSPRRVGTFSWPPAGTTNWPLTISKPVARNSFTQCEKVRANSMPPGSSTAFPRQSRRLIPK